MNRQRLLLLCLWLGTLPSLFAQNQVDLSIPDTTTTAGQRVCVPVVAQTFVNIASGQFSVEWDTLVVGFESLDLGANPLELSGADTSTSTSGTLAVAFITDDAMGITLDAGTELLRICFEPLVDDGFTPLTFAGFLEPEFVDAGTISAVPFDTTRGSLTINPTPDLAVLPGDTNADGQVDQTDILNLGLAAGATGPPRSGGTVTFTPTAATPWGESFPDGLNYAHADADGSGAINNADAAIVGNFFGQTVNADFTPPAALPDGNYSLDYLIAGEIVMTRDEVTSFEIVISPPQVAVPDLNLNGIAFSVETDGAFDLSQSNITFGQSFLTENGAVGAFSVAQPLPDGTTLGVALARNDGADATTGIGGQLLTLDFYPLQRGTDLTYQTSVTLVANRAVTADGTPINIGSVTIPITVRNFPVSTREPEWAAGLRVYPNPVSAGVVTLEGRLPRLSEIQVLDVAGRRVRTFAGTLRRLDLTDLPGGMYALRLLSRDGLVTRPLQIR